MQFKEMRIFSHHKILAASVTIRAIMQIQGVPFQEK